jgi:predicted transcriptional regulator
MAVTTSKVTYSLKPSTVMRVEELAVKWGVPKSEVIRRVVEQADAEALPHKKLTPLEAYLRFQRSGQGISQEQAEKFNAEVRRERRAWRKRG